MKQVSLLFITIIACLNVLAQAKGEASNPYPNLLKPVAPFLFCFKEIFKQENWQGYLRELNFIHADTTAATPDTSILYKGEKYYSNPKYLHWPMVGVSLEQINENCHFMQDSFNTIKSAGGGCNKRFWKKILRFDPHNEYFLKVYLPTYAEVKSHVENMSFILPVYFTDTMPGQPNKDFSKDSLFTFFIAARYVKRQ